jgi:hypothetical protein
MQFFRFTFLAVSLGVAIQAGSVRHEAIHDPALNMTAFDVNVPANWKFNGTFLQGTSCEQIPFPVFRMYSPDGLTELRRYPRLDWSWSTSKFKGAPHPDCLAITQELTAKQFLTYIMGVLQIAYTRDAPIPASVDQRKKFLDDLNARSAANARGTPVKPTVQHFDFASAFGEYKNGTFLMEAHLRAGVTCIRSEREPGAMGETCSANISMVRAPKGKLADVLAMVDADKIGAGPNEQWSQKYLQAQMAKNNAMLAQFRHDQAVAQAVRNRQHQEFMATMQAGTDRSMANARAIANSNHAIAMDWCDYSLDQQTVTGANGPVKVSSGYSQTWGDGSGHYYQTNNPNTDPNGALPGNWQKQTRVHGDGTPY